MPQRFSDRSGNVDGSMSAWWPGLLAQGSGLEGGRVFGRTTDPRAHGNHDLAGNEPEFRIAGSLLMLDAEPQEKGNKPWDCPTAGSASGQQEPPPPLAPGGSSGSEDPPPPPPSEAE